MKFKYLVTIFFLAAVALQANAGTQPESTAAAHSVGISWSYFGFNSTYSKNSEKRTFGTIGVNYDYRFNRWIAVNGRFGWSHSWFGDQANREYSYPKIDNAFLILAGCDVTWFQTGQLQLHSAVAGGLDIRVQKNDRGSYSTLGFAGQFDAVGLKYNWKHAFIDLSAGWGSMGCIKLGAGYIF